MGQVHVLWGLPFKKREYEIMDKKLGPRPWKGQPVTGKAPAAFTFA